MIDGGSGTGGGGGSGSAHTIVGHENGPRRIELRERTLEHYNLTLNNTTFHNIIALFTPTKSTPLSPFTPSYTPTSALTLGYADVLGQVLLPQRTYAEEGEENMGEVGGGQGKELNEKYVSM